MVRNGLHGDSVQDSPYSARAGADSLTGFRASSVDSHRLSAPSISSLFNLYLTASGREARKDSRGLRLDSWRILKMERLANFRGQCCERNSIAAS